MSALHASPGTLQVNNGMLCYRGICSRPVSVCLSVRPSQADIVMKRLDESSWFLAHRLPIYPTVCCCIIRKSGYLQKLGYFPQRLCATFRTLKISPRQVDRVVNSNGRRRRRSHTHTHTCARARAPVYLSGARCRLAYGPADATALTVSCFRKIQIGSTFLVPAHQRNPGQRAVKRVFVVHRTDPLDAGG